MKDRYIASYPYEQASQKASNFKNRTRAKQLLKISCNCHYCNRALVRAKSNVKSNFQPTNAATIDHVYERSDMRRALFKGYVLSCRHCNNQKQKELHSTNNNQFWFPALNEVFDIRNLLGCNYPPPIKTSCNDNQNKNQDNY